MTVNTTCGRIEDDLIQRLMHQRIIFLGEALEEGNGNRLMHQLLVMLAPRTPAPTSGCGSTPPAGRCRRCWRSATRCG